MKFTIKELAEKTNISQMTIRSWTMKPIDGVPYDSRNVNYDALKKGIKKYCPEFDVEDLEIVKGERAVSTKYIPCTDLVKDDKVILHNYGLKTELTYIKYDEEIDGHIFKTNEGKYKIWTTEDLTNTKQYKIERREEA